MTSKNRYLAFIIRLLLLIATPFSFTDAEPTGTNSKTETDGRVAFYVAHEIENFKDLIKNGVPEFFIPSLEPVKLPPVTLQGSPTEGARINAHHHDMTLYGLSSMEVSRVLVQLEQENLYMELNFNNWTVQGKYEMSGRLLEAIPIFGEGPFNMTCTNINVTGNAKITATDKGQLQVENVRLNLNAEDVDVYYQNLYGGGKLSILGNRLVKYFAKRTFGMIQGRLAQSFNVFLEKMLNRKFLETTLARIMNES